jgi:hypothetical protein
MPVNQTLPVFSRACGIELTNPKQVGVAFSLADGATEATVDAFVGFLGGKAPDYATFEACRLAWRDGYAEQRPGLVADSYDKAWSRFMARLQEYGEVVRPKAPTKDAVKKRAQREAAAPAVEYKTAQDARADSKAKMETAAAMPAGKEREDTLRAAIAAERAARKFDDAAEREQKAAREQVLKNRKDALRAILKDADGATVAVLEAAADLANEKASPEARAAAWGILTAIAPKAGKASKPATRRAA